MKFSALPTKPSMFLLSGVIVLIATTVLVPVSSFHRDARPVHSEGIQPCQVATANTDIETIFGTDQNILQLMEESKQRVIQEHMEEFQIGASVFGSTHSVRTNNDGRRTFEDDDFDMYDIGRNHFGPVSNPAAFNDNCHFVFETREPVFTPEDCDYFIDAARRTIAAEDQQVQEATNGEKELTNSDLGEARLSALPPKALDHLRYLLKTRLYPLLESRFGVQNDLTLYDGLILGNIAPTSSQPVHRDASLLTLNIPLSSPESFTGGGTYIEPLEDGFASPLTIERGKALCHFSGIRHAGTGIQTGERWVFVMFLLAKDEPQIARRCHAEGLNAVDRKDLVAAQASFLAGQSESPNDHLLHLGLGSIASIQGNSRKSYQCLVKATQSYPLDRKAVLAKGNMLLAKNRPRAALRQLEGLLEDIGDRDQTTTWMPLKALAWEARIAGARAAMLCAEREASKYKANQLEGVRPWATTKIPRAIRWIELSLMAAPNDGRLHGLLARARELLDEASG